MNAPVHSPSLVPVFDNSKPIRALLKRAGIQDLLDMEGVTEVAINRPGELWYEKQGTWVHVPASHLDFTLCRQLAQSLAVQVANDSSQLQSSPICPVLLPDGERGQIVVPPATERECISFTIRKPSTSRYSMDDYHESGRLSGYKVVEKRGDIEDFQKEMVMCLKKDDLRRFFKIAVDNKQNLLFGGATGSGKTTFSKAVVDLYPANRRYITIEDIHELQMPNHPNRVHLFFGPHITAKKLVESCMRMKGDHIFMSELKGDETWSYLSLLNTGHNGSLTTAHFNDCASAPARLSQMVKQSDVGMTLDYDFIYKTVQTSIDVVCFWKGSYLKEIRYEPEEKLRLLNGE
ncbi:TPA: P-type DNA transfer ATPase VirB11 [Pseudomonas aeruginosa]|uniref:P-type DNA transfer ATPase VirB11 n=1 Tax=Pseudomonas aeruginosa TaxID=287 RepID=UPI000E67DF20|nr:P-type DNA transfer ATPase VirB11 [Pseudomonas aeruginosa]RIY89791.1 P-type DNA transfer ATPase VirB11 [Pseudomonas aeruginosa]RPM25847.1 P-type DNA transfer ATPase VirB11 [Pseudomonas aeruginosa]HBP4970060.1 P-type DNA transfer ATPase VirB11 [Pseudomonas aeruginosa]